jgi:6-phosphogluconolactonase (cycloisomerase 2 family)
MQQQMRGLRVALAAGTLVAAMSGGGVAAASESSRTASGADLRAGGVFTMTNERGGNHVVAFARAANGRLKRLGSFATGGTGSGSFEDTANGLVLGSAEGESAPNNLIESSDLLFATNARSNTITVFRVRRHGLQRIDVEPSGGEKPVSLTVNRGVLYVLNSGEATDDLFDSEGNAIPNCTTGTPSITGFTVSPDGALAPIAGSTRRLSGEGGSGCAQISFTPSGDVLVVTERSARDEGPPGSEGDEGLITTFTRNADGTLSGPMVTEATGEGPFGFTFNKRGDLFTTEQFDGPLGPGRGAAAGYQVNPDGTLVPASPSVQNGGTDTCWFVITDDGRYGYATSFFGMGQISIYRTRDGGGLELLQANASFGVPMGASDISLSRDSRFLYQLNAFTGRINAFEVKEDGGLRLVQTVEATGASRMAARIGLAAS